MSTSSEGGSEGGAHRIVDILQPAAVESPGGEQSSNLSDYGFNYGTLKKLLNEFAKSLSMTSTIGTGAATAMSDDTRREGSTVAVDGVSTRPNQGLENGGVPDESTGGGVAAETFAGDCNKDNDNYKESTSRIFQMSTTTDVVMNLGCRCQLDLGRAHGVCAETWFRFVSLPGRKLVDIGRQCEICGQIAKYVQIPEAMDNNAPSKQSTNIANNGHLFIGGCSSESDDREDRRNGLGSIVDNSLENYTRHRNSTVTRPKIIPPNLANAPSRHDRSIDKTGCSDADGKLAFGVFTILVIVIVYLICKWGDSQSADGPSTLTRRSGWTAPVKV